MSETHSGSVVKVINRVGWSVIYLGGLAADLVNSTGYRKDHSEWLGSLTNHVGDICWGGNLGTVAFVGPKLLEKVGFSENKAKVISWSAVGLLALGLIAAEMGGVGNTPDMLDLPAMGIGMLSSYLMWNTFSQNKSEKQKTIQTG